jgi:hypothetical protein
MKPVKKRSSAPETLGQSPSQRWQRRRRLVPPDGTPGPPSRIERGHQPLELSSTVVGKDELRGVQAPFQVASEWRSAPPGNTHPVP